MPSRETISTLTITVEVCRQRLFMTDAFSDHAVRFLEGAATDDKPFFLYVAYIAPHWPLHAHEKDIAVYRDRYRERGWDEWRQTRFAKQNELGLLPPGIERATKSTSLHRWKGDPRQDWQAGRMAAYAAQITNVDRDVGRIPDVVKHSGKERDTHILFLSDNAAAPDGGVRPSTYGFGFNAEPNTTWRGDGGAIKGGSGPELQPGTHDTFAACGLAWATTSNTPLRDTKQSAYEG